jgi:hypothetical protein
MRWKIHYRLVRTVKKRVILSFKTKGGKTVKFPAVKTVKIPTWRRRRVDRIIPKRKAA